MRRLSFFALLVCFFTVSVSKAQIPQTQDCDLVLQALQAAQTLKTGDTRSKLDKDFMEDGGMQVRSKTRYMFKKCRYIRVDVNFEVPADNKMEFVPTDKILSVSKPYLDYPTMD